jgi:hypothetical protein
VDARLIADIRQREDVPPSQVLEAAVQGLRRVTRLPAELGRRLAT